MTSEQSRDEPDSSEAPKDRPGEVGSEGGSESARHSTLPAIPDEGDDSPVGDTDQHSSS